jgi:glycyl-tRNA synthetase
VNVLEGEAEEKEKERKKRKKVVKTTAIKLSDDVVEEYEIILAKVIVHPPFFFPLDYSNNHIPRKLDNYSGPELGEFCRKYDIRNLDTNNEVGEPQQFNLIFKSSIGPTGQHPG